MSQFSEYLFAASVVALSSVGDNLVQTYVNQESAEQLILQCLKIDVDIEEIRAALRRFVKEEIVDFIEDDLGGNFYRFNKFRISKKLGEFRQSPDTVGGKVSKVGLQLFHAVVENSKNHSEPSNRMPLEAAKEAPASDRIVRLDHNQRGEVEEPLNEVLSLVESENSIDGEDGLRELVLGRLRAGRELIRAGIFTINSLQLTLVIGLKMLIERYGDHAIGAIAGKLLDLLLKQLGIG